jgi:hypothetical protein
MGVRATVQRRKGAVCDHVARSKGVSSNLCRRNRAAMEVGGREGE